MENYMAKVRPEPAIRNKFDISYEIENNSVTLNEIRPVWNDPQKKIKLGYAKTTYVKCKNIWNVFWKRSDNKWHLYAPQPNVSELTDFLKLVDKDEHGCFKG